MFDELEHVSDRVIVAGDLFDLDRPRLGRLAGPARAIERAYPDVVSAPRAITIGSTETTTTTCG